MYETDIMVILYPSAVSIEKVLILDPFDQKVLSFDVSSLEEAKEVLRNNLPFCSQGHSPIIHMGDAYVVSWSELQSTPSSIKTPEDVDKVLK